MILAIQQAYYLRAMNPSDDATLKQLARELGLDRRRFAHDLASSETKERLQQEIQLAQGLPINGFPSLVLKTRGGHLAVPLDYRSADNIMEALEIRMSL